MKTKPELETARFSEYFDQFIETGDKTYYDRIINLIRKIPRCVIEDKFITILCEWSKKVELGVDKNS